MAGNGDLKGTSFEVLQAVQRGLEPFKAVGIGYAARFNRHRPIPRKLRMEPYAGIVSIAGERVTVKAGTLLSQLSDALDRHNLALATLPEFTGLTAGACFFVDVHGSSCDHFCLRDLIVEVKYLDGDGNTAVATPGDDAWESLRRRTDRLILTELTFECVEAGYLTNEPKWLDDDALDGLIASGHRENLSTTVQWYPTHGKCFVYNINRAGAVPERFVKAQALYRGSPYGLQRGIARLKMRGRPYQYDRYHHVLGPWKDLPARKLMDRLRPNGSSNIDVELCLPLEAGGRFIAALRKRVRAGEKLFSRTNSLGLRFSYRKTGAGSPGDGYLWVELVSRERALVDRFVAIAREVCGDAVRFHEGKFVP